ncbi:hypothetical protein BGZ51_000359 [Haplosporangium sp. Z 767]|nr:hypothetical protein BGZ50_002922 [Haplosporangium sp. Z 11]KAF9188761.1 hypothetical protein BGZ51_000359 [Haplosporangium sp. Z 767]
MATAAVDEGSQQGYQLKDEPVTVSPGMPVRAVQNSGVDASLYPVLQKSEDWGALVDTPASPIHSRHPSTMPLGGESYADSPVPENAAADYLRHVSHPSYNHQPYSYPHSYQPNEDPALQRPHPMHANTDPLGTHHNLPYQHHQRHGSSPTIPLSQDGTSDATNETRNATASRRSWSASDTLNGAASGAYGYLTPPRYASDANGRSRPHLGMKQGSVATSVSLLTDAAILAKYRDTANKTNDVSIQLSYAKYLLELGDSSLLGSSSSSSPESTPRPSSAESNSNSPSPPPSPTSQDPQVGKKQLTTEAIYWIDRLAKEGQPEAQFMKGMWYEEGSHGSKRNADKALRWFQSASKGDYAPAHYKVGFYCEKKKDNNKAVVLYKKAAIHNDVPANHRLAIIYLYGELGQTRNMKAGLQYLKRAASFATENAPMSPYVLGLILSRDYSKQLVIPDDIAFPDDSEALEWFRKSAQLGYGPANYKLGYCYEYGSLGCPIDPYLSVQHYERAMRAGDSNGEAEMALSGWYLSGAENCFSADDQLAFSYAAKAAEKQLAKAQYAMGYYHEVGIATAIDMAKAMEFYKLAAANGNKDAKKRLEEKAASYDKLEHKNSIRRIKQGRKAKDNSCAIM